MEVPSTSQLKSPLNLPERITDDVLEILDSNENISVEEPSDSSSDGHMPISLQQMVGSNQEYKILQKLGSGHFSTVWFCQDTTSEEEAFYALKVSKSASKYRQMAQSEIKILLHINDEEPGEVGHNRIISLQDFFIENNLNANYVCMVFEVMGPTLYDLMKKNDFCGFRQDLVKTVVKQVLEGLKYLHEKCNVIHADLKLDNVMLAVDQSYLSTLVTYTDWFDTVDVLLPKPSLGCIGLEKQNQQSRTTGASRKRSYRSDDNESSSDPNSHIQIKIGDFGNARYKKEGQHGTIQAVSYRALEVIIEADYSFPADVWSVACMAFEFATGMHMFYIKNSENLPSTLYHLGLIWKICNGIPKHIALSGRQSKEFFDEQTGKLKKIKKESLNNWKLSDFFVSKFAWRFVDAILVEDFLLKLIEPDPEKRVTASEALEIKWLNS